MNYATVYRYSGRFLLPAFSDALLDNSMPGQQAGFFQKDKDSSDPDPAAENLLRHEHRQFSAVPDRRNELLSSPSESSRN